MLRKEEHQRGHKEPVPAAASEALLYIQGEPPLGSLPPQLPTPSHPLAPGAVLVDGPAVPAPVDLA